MIKVLRCNQTGMDCEFVARGETEQQVLEQAVEHAHTYHGMEIVPGDVIDLLRAAIRDERRPRTTPGR